VIAIGGVVAEPIAVAPADAWGAGFTSWWRSHGKEMAELAACVVEGLGVARLLTAGSFGGIVGAAALAAGVLGCV
jgi:hypothetical protein